MVNFLTEDLSQNVSNKTLLDQLRLTEIAAPGTPSSGLGFLYVKSTDSKLYFKNDAGTEYDLTDSGGAGSKWTDNGSYTYLTATTDNVVIGSATQTSIERFMVGLSGSNSGSSAEKILGIYVPAATVNFSTAQTGNVYINTLGIPTLTGTASQTIPFSSTLYIPGAPVPGTNTTISFPYSLYVDSGHVRIDDYLLVGDLSEAQFDARLNVYRNQTTEGVNGNAFEKAVFSYFSGGKKFLTAHTGKVYGSYIGGPIINGDVSQTVAEAYSLYIADAPLAGSNTTITTNYALRVAAGGALFNPFLDITEDGGSTPGTPPTSTGRLYVKSSDSKLYFKSDGGVEYLLATSGGNIWTDSGTVAYLTTTTDDLVVGATTQTSIEKVKVALNTAAAGSASARVVGINLPTSSFNFSTAQTGNVYLVETSGPTITGTASQTIPVAATLRLTQAPIAGTNTTINGSYTLLVDDGPSRFDGNLDFSAADVTNIILGTTNGTKIGTATSQKLGFFNATPVTQPSASTDLRVALINLGLYQTGGVSPLDLNGGALTAGSATINGTIMADAWTSDDAGGVVLFEIGSTNGTKFGNSTTDKIGFYNTTPIVQPATITQTYATASATHTGDVAGLTSTAVTPTGFQNGTDFNTMRDAVTNIKQVVNGLIDKLQSLGLIA